MVYKFEDVRLEQRRIENQKAEHLTARLTAEASVLFVPSEANFNIREVVESDLRTTMHRTFYGDIQDRLAKLEMLTQFQRGLTAEFIAALKGAIESVAEPHAPAACASTGRQRMEMT